jgi:hypothetical protein
MIGRICLLLTVLCFTLGGASDGPLDRGTLRGITAVNVVIDPIAPEIGNEGASSDAIRTRLEQRLRDAGIKLDPASSEFVAFRLSSVRAGRGPFAIAATIGLYQPVILARDKNLRTATQTWEVATVLLADAKQVNRACLDSVDELAGRFVSAYKSVNDGGEAGRGQ